MRLRIPIAVLALAVAVSGPGRAVAACRGDGATVRWVECPDERDRELHEDWCATLGEPVWAPVSREPAEVDSFAVLSWNLQVGGGDLVALVEALERGDLTEGRRVDDYVLLVQEGLRLGDSVPRADSDGRAARRIFEMPPSGVRLDVVQVAQRLGLSLFYVPSMRNGSAREDRGNAVLSTFPLSDPTAIVLPYEAQRRVAAAVTVEGRTDAGSEWQLRVCSAHLDVRSRPSRLFATFGSGRRRQAEALAAAVPETPAVVGGDFNTWAPAFLESSVRYLREQFPEPAEPDRSATRRLPAMRDRRLDHLMFRLPAGWSADYRVVEDRFASDHHPLIGWLRVGE